MAKRVYFNATSPVGVAAFPHLHAPDTEGKFADNKFKIQLLVGKDADLSAMRKAINDCAVAEFGPDYDRDNLITPIKDGADKADKEGFEHWAQKFVIVAKTKSAPKLFDSAGKPLPKSVKIGFGDEVRIKVAASPFTKTEKVRENGKMVDVTVQGVTLYLNMVQLVAKNSGGMDGFDAYEGGYVADDADDSAPFDTDGGDF
ncbi:ssDNA-binding protein [Nitrospirillum iridis]|uniref:DUF2815 family protein n=1 Tax=Nitrospirillum iridis TaxID=765888 RepID=A0A7X0B0F6_9PROT|nr:ssDNA-binding protein [Nitrospirillum iridis]MBB6253052.1 hypothetical protein [Nitrospirillum iridis]